MIRDWKKDPPKTIEDGFELAFEMASVVCENIRREYGHGPRPVRTATGYEFIWPDGEVTNRIDVEMIQ